MTALAPRPRSADASADALVDAAIDGDESAWEVLCDRHLDEVRAVAHARLRDRHAAEDVVQETMLRAWCRLHQLDDARRIGAWLKTIAANVAIDHVRAQRPTAPLDVAPDTAALLRSHDDHVVEREDAAALRAHMAELREVDRRALWQRDGLGVPVGELADELGMTTGSVRVLLTRARGKVRDRYGLLVAPLIALAARNRARLAGLGEAVPVAVIAPVLVVATVAGVTVPDWSADAPAVPTTDQITPAPATISTDVTMIQERAATSDPAPAPTPSATRTAPVTEVQQTPTEAPDADAGDGPRVDLGRESAGFSDEAPTDDDQDMETPAPAGPVEGVEVFFEETGVGDLGQDCVLCG